MEMTHALRSSSGLLIRKEHSVREPQVSQKATNWTEEEINSGRRILEVPESLGFFWRIKSSVHTVFISSAFITTLLYQTEHNQIPKSATWGLGYPRNIIPTVFEMPSRDWADSEFTPILAHSSYPAMGLVRLHSCTNWMTKIVDLRWLWMNHVKGQ